MMNYDFVRMAALLFVGACLTACSGSEETIKNTTSYSEPGNTVVLKGLLATKKGDSTRSVSNTGVATWQTGEQIAIYYQKSDDSYAMTTATVQSDDNDQSTATFTAELQPPKQGSTVKLVYPAARHDGAGGFSTAELMTEQVGTLEDVSANWDIATATAELTAGSGDDDCTLNNGQAVVLSNQLCLYKLTMYREDHTSFTATQLEISDGTHNYTITPASAANTFTVALLPVQNATFTFSATSTSPSKNYLKRNGVTLENCTSENVGDVFDKDGNIYQVSDGTGYTVYGKSFNDITLPSGHFYSQDIYFPVNIKPVAMIAYVGDEYELADASGYRGLAMAMDDVYDGSTSEFVWAPLNQGYDQQCSGVYNSSTFTDHRDCADMKGIDNTWILANHECSSYHRHPAAEAAYNYSVAGFTPSDLGCSNWFLPSSGQWFKFFEACGVDLSSWSSWLYSHGGASDYTKVVTNTMNNAGANYSSRYMWSSSQYNENCAVYVGFLTSVGVNVYYDYKRNTLRVRPFLAFDKQPISPFVGRDGYEGADAPF